MALRLIEMMVPKASAGDLKSCLGDQPVLELHGLHCGGGQTFVRISNAARFHRGMSLVLLVLAVFILVVEIFRCQTHVERWMVGSTLGLIGVTTLRLMRGFWSAPALEKERLS